MALHTFIRDERPVSIQASRFRGFRMIAKFLKTSQAQQFFSSVVLWKVEPNCINQNELVPMYFVVRPCSIDDI